MKKEDHASAAERDPENTGMHFGIGQSTSTGTDSEDGGPDLSGTAEGSTVGTDTKGGGKPPHGHTSDYVSNKPTLADERSRHGGRDETDIDEE